MRKYFEVQIEANRDEYPDFNLSAMTYPQLSALNVINLMTINEIEEYEFSN